MKEEGEVLEETSMLPSAAAAASSDGKGVYLYFRDFLFINGSLRPSQPVRLLMQLHCSMSYTENLKHAGRFVMRLVCARCQLGERLSTCLAGSSSDTTHRQQEGVVPVSAAMPKSTKDAMDPLTAAHGAPPTSDSAKLSAIAAKKAASGVIFAPAYRANCTNKMIGITDSLDSATAVAS